MPVILCGIVFVFVFVIKFLNRLRKRVYKVNPMDSYTDEVPEKKPQGCWAWCGAKADAFRVAVARTCCDCCAAIPSLVLVLMALFILVLVLSAIPMAVVLSYMAPQTSDSRGPVQLEDVSRFSNAHDTILDRFAALPPLSTSLLKPPNVTSCVEYGFSCTKTPSVIISMNRRCDGHADCADGSDEMDCEECLTAFSCPTKTSGHQRQCLRGAVLCDGRPDCADQSDELLYCHSECEDGHYKCKNADRCVPNEFRCDGDVHCPGGDDEDECRPEECAGGAVFCKSTGHCIPVWNVCDGSVDCDNAADEMNCNCTTCSSAHSALCTISNMCVEKSAVCNGIIDCLNGEDEMNCAGQCTGLPDIRPNDVVCSDGKNYGFEYACSGLFPQCDGKCKTCHEEVAMQCGEICLHRSRVCNGKADCPNGEDEQNCPDQCDDPSRVCDGYAHCTDERDEKDCQRCKGGALHCRADNKCVPSHRRCDGVAHCSDAQDELNCECKDCAMHPEPMYFCEQSARCFPMHDVCNPRTKCPNPSRLDKMYCATRNTALHFF